MALWLLSEPSTPTRIVFHLLTLVSSLRSPSGVEKTRRLRATAR